MFVFGFMLRVCLKCVVFVGLVLAVGDVCGQQPARSMSKLEAERFLANCDSRVEKESGRLSVLIPQAQHASDVIRALAAHPYGTLDPEVVGAYKAVVDLLVEQDSGVREGEDGQQIVVLEKEVSDRRKELLRQVAEAEAVLQDSSASTVRPERSTDTTSSQGRLRATDRSNMKRGVIWAKLVKNRREADALSDEQLRDLYIQAQPILNSQNALNIANQAARAAEKARATSEQLFLQSR